MLKDELKDARNDYEDACLRRLVLPAGVTILAGFADTKLFDFLGELGFGYVIRLKGNTRVGAGRPGRLDRPGRASCAMPPRHNARKFFCAWIRALLWI